MVRTKTIVVTYVTCLECGQEAMLRLFKGKLQIGRHKGKRKRRRKTAYFNIPDCPSSNTANYDRKSMKPVQELRMSI